MDLRCAADRRSSCAPFAGVRALFDRRRRGWSGTVQLGACELRRHHAGVPSRTVRGVGVGVCAPASTSGAAAPYFFLLASNSSLPRTSLLPLSQKSLRQQCHCEEPPCGDEAISHMRGRLLPPRPLLRSGSGQGRSVRLWRSGRLAMTVLAENFLSILHEAPHIPDHERHCHCSESPSPRTVIARSPERRRRAGRRSNLLAIERDRFVGLRPPSKETISKCLKRNALP